MSADRLRAYLDAHGIEATVREYGEPVETVDAAARVAGVSPARIVKSLVVVDPEGRAAVCMVPGPRRLSLEKAARALGSGPLRLARGEEVQAATGYPVGAVPPLGYPEPVPVLMDPSVLEAERIVAGGGARTALVEVDAAAVRDATGARLADLTA